MTTQLPVPTTDTQVHEGFQIVSTTAANTAVAHEPKENPARNFALMGFAWLCTMIVTLSLFVLGSITVHALFG